MGFCQADLESPNDHWDTQATTPHQGRIHVEVFFGLFFLFVRLFFLILGTRMLMYKKQTNKKQSHTQVNKKTVPNLNFLNCLQNTALQKNRVQRIGLQVVRACTSAFSWSKILEVQALPILLGDVTVDDITALKPLLGVNPGLQNLLDGGSVHLPPCLFFQHCLYMGYLRGVASPVNGVTCTMKYKKAAK